MPLIAVQTIRVARNQFELNRVRYVGFDATKEINDRFEEKDNDRLRAAIINVGFACRQLFDEAAPVSIVSIESDSDGADVRNGGEHNVLYSLLNPSGDFEARKHRALYADYIKLLDRISELKYKAKIEIKMHGYGEEPSY